MSSRLSIAYLTGSEKVIGNNFFSHTSSPRPSRTIGQMFFQPYESRDEFIYCARHTFQPLLLLKYLIQDPTLMINAIPAFLGAISFISAVIGKFSEYLGEESGAQFFLGLAEHLVNTYCQSLIDLVMLPLSVFVMLTRGISTGLQAAGIYGQSDAPQEAAATPNL